jgi:DNA ligase-1
MSQQLVLFKPVVVTGDRGNTYEVTMKPDHIYCTCPGWKFMRAPIQARRCKHVQRMLAGSAHVGFPSPPRTPIKRKRSDSTTSDAFEPALAEKWTTEDPSGWYRSEKLDGIRCLWTGSKLLTRNHNEIHAPASFIDELPPIPLDGELFLGRGRFSECMSIVRTQVPDERRWAGIVYRVFDAPGVNATFDQRVAVIQAVLHTTDTANAHTASHGVASEESFEPSRPSSHRYKSAVFL